MLCYREVHSFGVWARVCRAGEREGEREGERGRRRIATNLERVWRRPSRSSKARAAERERRICTNQVATGARAGAQRARQPPKKGGGWWALWHWRARAKQRGASKLVRPMRAPKPAGKRRVRKPAMQAPRARRARGRARARWQRGNKEQRAPNARTVDEQRRVAAVVDEHVGAAAVGPGQHLLGAPPVLLERLALPGKDGRRVARNRRRGVILRREDVAAAPAHVGAERGERLDQHGRLDGHVQRAGDARALERLLRAKLSAARHQAGHLSLGQIDLEAAKVGLGDVLDLVLRARSSEGGRGGEALSARGWRRLCLTPTHIRARNAPPRSAPTSRPEADFSLLSSMVVGGAVRRGVWWLRCGERKLARPPGGAAGFWFGAVARHFLSGVCVCASSCRK